MSGAEFGSFILGLIVVVIVVAVVVWLLHWLYLRSSKERAFVRTGFGGQKVVVDGGAFVLPILHDVIPVNMNTLRLEVSRGRDKALITQDRMRVDVIAEFYVRVAAQPEAVASAAQTLGLRTMAPEQLKELIEGKFVDALRTAAAEMSMEELHEKRGTYVRKVREAVAEDLLKNGLELESASLTQLDQTSMDYFNPSNAFDAEGLTRLTERIEQRKKQRNDVEQDTLIAIRNKNLEAEKLSLAIDLEAESAKLLQQRSIEVARARQRAEVISEKAMRDQDAEEAQISARQAIEGARIRSEQTIEQDRIRKERELQAAEIERRTALELAEQQRAIAVARESRSLSEAQTEAEIARSQAVAAEERVFTAREIEMAERRKAIELIAARQEAEREALQVTATAAAEKAASADRGEAQRAQALADADAERTRAEAHRVSAQIEAEALRQLHEAQNVLSPEARTSALRLKIVERADAIIRETVKPLERIEGIRILHVDGLGGSGAGASGAGASGEYSGGFADSVVNSALRFRAQAPIVDHLLREIGLEGSDVRKLAGAAVNLGAGAGTNPGAGLPSAMPPSLGAPTGRAASGSQGVASPAAARASLAASPHALAAANLDEDAL
ncbi:MAG: flotillin family protein [Betaproteobacteria bacterium]|nr:flotillin family protein [Betaproteobacteria bacterium]